MIIETNDDTFGKNIRFLRRKHWMTRRQLAAVAKWDIHSIKAVEKGTLRQVDNHVLNLLCTVFDLPMMILLKTDLKRDSSNPRK